jgi:membrane associated rhomboid family serine protease
VPRFRFSVTKLLLIINTVLFALISLYSFSLFSPSSHALVMFGAKVPILLAQGEWWRLLTPIFLHVGILHFALNNLGLKYIGPFFERILGKVWYLGIYVTTGIIGNIASGFTNLSIGAGASGALFGLVGVGMMIEWQSFAIHQRGFAQIFQAPFTPERLLSQLGVLLRVVRAMTFTWLAVINIAIAVGFNLLMSFSEGASIGIDNAAHLGGMGSGMLLGLVFLWIVRGTNEQRWQHPAGYALLALLGAGIAWGAYTLCATDYIVDLYLRSRY